MQNFDNNGAGGWNNTTSSRMSLASLAEPTSTVELSVSCDKLVNKDLASKSDPFCVMFESHAPNQWTETGRTEVVVDSLSPRFVHKFVVTYNFERRQPVKFQIYDQDSTSTRLTEHDFLGECVTTLGAVVSSAGGPFPSVLKDPKGGGNQGKIFITAEELASNKEEVALAFRAEGLDKKDFFGKSDPFMVISKGSASTGQFVPVHQTEVVMSNLNPTWKPFTLTCVKLCNGNYDRKLRFDVYDWDSDGSHDYIGSFTTTLAALKGASEAGLSTAFTVVNEKKKNKKGDKYKGSGKVFMTKFQIVEKPSFLDYLQTGTAMNFSVAVDFTASNGPPSDPRSLHHLNPHSRENQYTTAIRSVGEIIQDYDTDRQFPALGFGARIPPNYQVSHEFFLNLSPSSPFCSGVEGLLQAYHTSLQHVKLYGPTNFSPVINHVANFARAYQSDGRQYFVLLILTDGIITDMEATVAAIVAASSLPMSIIIVGVGDEDFSSMEVLDGDSQALRSGGHKASRDIVQFVELRKFITGPSQWNKEALAKEVLAEIPDQLVKWMMSKGITPQKPQ